MTTLRVRIDHQCHILGLELDDMCDKCKYFEQSKRGICGHKAGGGSSSKMRKTLDN